jgi:UDP-N-acetylglucosamine:LPS N-acetylglucosamine transferase
VQAIEVLRPHAVVVVHPLLTHPAAAARRLAGRVNHVPLVTVITDLVTVHRLWTCPEVDHFVAGTPFAAEAVADTGVAPARIHVLGVPVSPQFSRLNISARDMRARLKLDPDQPVVLVMGGGEGVGDLYGVVVALASRRPDAQLVVLTGRNGRLRQRLEARAWPGKVRILGYAGIVAELMTAADVIVTKPGSLTIAEACATGRSLVLLPPLPGQEDGNVAYIVDAEAGLATREPDEAAEAVDHLLRLPAKRWEMSQRAARLGQPRAAARVLDFVQGLMLATSVPRW